MCQILINYRIIKYQIMPVTVYTYSVYRVGEILARLVNLLLQQKNRQLQLIIWMHESSNHRVVDLIVLLLSCNLTQLCLPYNLHNIHYNLHKDTHRTGHQSHNMYKSRANYTTSMFQTYHNAENIAA